ncbi:MAG TPA: phosphoribosylaminoimidazolesuccinocarboxamide synthase [bacterium]|nr:phosphoribosylaminoimidazolesuccinocarboxamide synthase [bacterium]
MKAVFESELLGMELVKRGKVRDVYQTEDRDKLLIVACDRLSAFDVVMPTPVPGKGIILTQMSNFWFEKTRGIISNHIIQEDLSSLRGDDLDHNLKGRAVIVRKSEPVQIEAIVRGYISGSGWNEYKRTGSVCGISMPFGLKESEKLAEPIFTPSTKAPAGQHDENIPFDDACQIVGENMAKRVRDISLELYSFAADYAFGRGIIIADTKFEFGISEGELILIDEAFTPDSSRFWPVNEYQAGGPQRSFDKQYVRDYLESMGWNKKPPAPELPPDVIDNTIEKYKEALSRIIE